MWERLCRALSADDLLDDDRFSDNRARVGHREMLDARVAQLVGERSFSDLERSFNTHGVAYGSVNSVVDIVNDPHILEREDLVRVSGTDGSYVLMQAPVPKFSLTPGEIRSAGPEAGDHTDEVLAEICGLDTAALSRLRTQGVI